MKNQNDFRMCNNANARPVVDIVLHRAGGRRTFGRAFLSVKSTRGTHYNICDDVCVSHAGVTRVRVRACAADEVERARRAAGERRAARGRGVPRLEARGALLPRASSCGVRTPLGSRWHR